MKHATSQALRVIALGDFAGEIPPLAPRLAALNVAPLRSAALDRLPAALDDHDVLLTELDWLNGLAADQRADLAARVRKAAGWIALTDGEARFKEQVDWQRTGVSHFFRKPLIPERLAALLEDIHDRLDGPPIRVILLDDEESALSYYGATLEQAGFVVAATQDPLIVLDAIEEFQPDLLLVDIEMPGCRGPELVTIVRQRPEYAHLPVIFLTAMEGMSDLLLARQAAAEDFLPKPVAPELLLAAVQSQAWRHRSRLRNESQHRQQEARARYRLEQLQQALDKHAIVSAADAAGNIVYVNDKFCELSGYSREELLGQNHRIVKSGEHQAEFYDDLWQTITSGNIWQGEICNRCKNGSPYWVEATIVPFLDAKGKPTQYISIRTDITALKQSEAALRESDERLRRSQVFANIGTWDWNIQTGELYWSERIAPLFGHSLGELDTSYENFLNALHPDDRQAVIDAVNACVERDAPYEIEHRVVWPDGQVRWLLEKGAVTRDTGGKPLHMLGVVQDIQRRKTMEAALAESEERFAFAVSGAGDGIWDWNMQSGTMLLSGNYEGMLGYARGELAQTIDAWVQSVHPDDQAEAQQTLQDYLADRLPAYALELRLRCKDGQYKWILCRGTVVKRDATGQPTRMIGIHSDVSARKLIEMQLIEARESAERANQAKSDFLSSMSHELRTPMNAIIGFAQMLEYDEQLNADQLDNVQEILKGGRHLLELINEVLDLAKIESGRIDLSIEAVDLTCLAEDCRQLIQPLAAQRGVTVAINVPPGIAARADRVRLKQVLLNLLSNAVKYNREGGDIRLEVRPAADAHLRIEVADSGSGIAPERIEEIFQPFNRLDAEYSEIEGTGIGLTITLRLVEMMGGTVGVASEVGKGSTFWIELPQETQAVPAETMPSPTAQPGSAPVDHQHLVLSIDDNPVNLKLIAQILARRRHIDLITAHTPELGIELALAHRPDLILLDINMPGMDGYQVLEVFKADARLKGIPVIAVTANAMKRDVELCRAAGFDDYLAKPFDVATFLQTIDRRLAAAKGKPT